MFRNEAGLKGEVPEEHKETNDSWTLKTGVFGIKIAAENIVLNRDEQPGPGRPDAHERQTAVSAAFREKRF